MVVAFSWMDKGNEGWRRRIRLGQWENKEYGVLQPDVAVQWVRVSEAFSM
jgi:hypothetical protein